jgi:hypothetical protein
MFHLGAADEIAPALTGWKEGRPLAGRRRPTSSVG